MKKEVKIARELIKLAKQIVGANQFENTHSDDAAKIQAANITDLINYLEHMIQLYMTHSQNRGKFMASLNQTTSAIKRPLVLDLVNDPLLIEDTLMKVRGVQLPYGAIKKDVENSIISIDKVLSDQTARDLQAAHKSTFGIVSRFSQIGMAILQRLNRAYQHMQANDGNADIAFVQQALQMLKKYNMDMESWESQTKNKTDWDNGSELRTLEQVNKGTREQMGTANTIKPIAKTAAGITAVKIALDAMERSSKNIYVAITYLDSTTGLLNSSEKKIFALSSISNILNNGINNADRDAQGIKDNKGSGWAVPFSEKKSSSSSRRRLTAGVGSDLDGALNDLNDNSTTASRRTAGAGSDLDNALNDLNDNSVTASRRTAGVFSDVVDWLAKKGSALIDSLKNVYNYFADVISNLNEVDGLVSEAAGDDEEVNNAIHEVAEWLRENVQEN